MLVQTQRAIENLKASGLKRSEFHVRTPYQVYGDTEIVLFCKMERAIEVAPKLAEHKELLWNPELRTFLLEEFSGKGPLIPSSFLQGKIGEEFAQFYHTVCGEKNGK